jgi:hypothetical protein
MNPDVILAQLYALRAQIHALIVQVESSSAPAVPITGACPHPEDKQRNATTGGGGPQKVLCLQCGEERPA